MRETLYLRLGHSPDAEVEFGVASSDLRALRTQRGRLADAAAVAGGRRVVAFLPAASTRLAQVELPGRMNARLLQAVPYALEEQLAEDVESLHFAVGERQADGQIPVAVIATDSLEQWLAALADAGLRPEGLVPEALALPVPEPGGATVLLCGEEAIARLSAHAGFCCDAEALDDYLALEDIGPSAPVCLYLAAGTQRDGSVRGPATRLLPAPSALHVLANGLSTPQAINLLQGPYSERQGIKKHLRPWALAASLLLAWASVLIR